MVLPYDFVLGHLSQRNKNLFQAQTCMQIFIAAYRNNPKLETTKIFLNRVKQTSTSMP